jgi:hypothetical protein
LPCGRILVLRTRPVEVGMWLVIVGGIIVCVVGLAAVYDYISRRHGGDNTISASGPMAPTIDPVEYHEDSWTGR